eukprot:TRINITY_DN4090_c0_g1_i1.p1 TRINITY_DN4090_c0_g1~~TRINITY_DN4090_c0_g1_i1.p1  ORF type:complete len:662 (-),score=112.09 TRINITY_DN4090_c0_g1_i1:191-2176(-)
MSVRPGLAGGNADRRQGSSGSRGVGAGTGGVSGRGGGSLGSGPRVGISPSASGRSRAAAAGAAMALGQANSSGSTGGIRGRTGSFLRSLGSGGASNRRPPQIAASAPSAPSSSRNARPASATEDESNTGGGGVGGGSSSSVSNFRGYQQEEDALPRNPTASDLDPFGLHGELFEYITHRDYNGEALAGYRVCGHPMVLHSLVDGSPLVSLHMRVSGAHPQARALIARRPDDDGRFLGVVSVNDVAIELIMTNLTTEDVLMMDIGGDPRTRDDELWDRDDRTFWGGTHKNDERLNRSNILWPMQPNICVENNLHFRQTGERRQIVLRTEAGIAPSAQSRQLPQGDAAAASSAALARTTSGVPEPVDASSYPLWVYPRHGSRTAAKFAQTAWSCPESIVVIGTPNLIGEARFGRNIIESSPIEVVQNDASGAGMPLERLLMETNPFETTLAASPPSSRGSSAPTVQEETTPQRLQQGVLADLNRERAEAAPPTPVPPILPVATAPSRTTAAETAAMGGATRAQIYAGGRLNHNNIHGLLIERFDFAVRGAPAVVTLAVDVRVQHLAVHEGGQRAVAESRGVLRAALEKRIGELADGRTEALRKEVSSVFSTSECVICLCGDTPPDVILYQCGHRCAHLECLQDARLRRCPLCRSLVVALLPCN